MIEVLSVASEIYPLIKTGGLADVTGALPGALAPLGVSMRTLVQPRVEAEVAFRLARDIDVPEEQITIDFVRGAVAIERRDLVALLFEHVQNVLRHTGHTHGRRVDEAGADHVDENAHPSVA